MSGNRGGNPSSNTAVAGLLSGLLWLIARLPAPARALLVNLCGGLYARFGHDARRTIVANLRHARRGLVELGVEIEDPETFARQNLRASMQLLDETAICWRGREGAWRTLIDSVQGDNVDEVLALLSAASNNQHSQFNGDSSPSTQRVLLLSPHLGNWELLNMYLGAEFGLTVLYDPPKIAALDPLIRRARERTLSTVLPIGSAGLRGMVQRLKAGAVVGLLPDQVPPTDAGVRVPFFGKQALTINFVHRLVARFQPRVFLVCAIRNSSQRFDIYFDELTQAMAGAGEASATAAMNAAIEARIAQAPEQYQWSYKRYKRAVEGAPNIYRT